MPEVSRFYGIVITLYRDDHPEPHFHASYGEFEAAVAIGSLAVLRGHLPPRANRLVREWATLRRHELLTNWTLARTDRPLRKIEPLA